MGVSKRREIPGPEPRLFVTGASGLRQAIEARHEHALNGVWHRDCFLLVSIFEDRPSQFLEEEGLPSALAKITCSRCSGTWRAALRTAPLPHHPARLHCRRASCAYDLSSHDGR